MAKFFYLAAEAVEHGGQLVNQGVVGADMAMGQGATPAGGALGKILATHQHITARGHFLCPAAFRAGVNAGKGANWHVWNDSYVVGSAKA